MIKCRGIILSLLLGGCIGFVSLFYDTNTNEMSHQLMCYPDARFIDNVYIDIFRLTESIYAVEIRKIDGSLIREGYFTFNSGDTLNNFDVISYDNGNLKLKDGTVMSIRNKR
ncbi:hypothetical protein [Salmonella enterica]|uniref:hypothetical protein n=1 Tax=Salmonella enterica TaxID=28901 RepID=UPI000B8B775C|nr:hypothetical protein [Salmonella enterica]OXM29459.1 hypothetical protein NW10_17135 [Salmonella enterica subsp. enterica serovar Weslaco]